MTAGAATGGAEPGAQLTSAQAQRYSRHLLLPQLGSRGQRRLLDARVAVVGAGGLGSAVLPYLVAAGVGTVTIIDDDRVELSNLHRQIIHGTGDLGVAKTASARAALARLDPAIEVITVERRLTAENALDLLSGHDVVVDGADNFTTRYTVDDACVLLGLPHVWGSILGFDGQVSVWWAGHGPCLRCVFPHPPAAGEVPSCAESGVLGALCGIVGSIMATETIKILLGQGDPLIGRVLVHDALAMRFDTVPVRADPDCPLCGTEPTITAPLGSGETCSGPAATTAAEVGSSAVSGMPIRSGAPGGSGVPEVFAADLRTRLRKGESIVLVDVRGPQEIAATPMPTAVPIHLDAIRAGQRFEEIGRLAGTGQVVFVCASGVRSAEAAGLARANGIDGAATLVGGVLAWLAGD